MKQEQAESVALQALSFIVSDENRLARFLALSGMEGEDLKKGVSSPAFLGGVLDHMLAHEEDLLAFAQEGELDPFFIQRARATLPGQNPDW